MRTALLLLLAALLIAPCWAGQITIVSGQKDYYFLTGEDATLPLVLNTTYDHDIRGTLRSITEAERPGGNATRLVQEKSFTVFTGGRSCLLPAGRSDEPRVVHTGIEFMYPDNGGRKVLLEDIVIHFVTTPGEIVVNPDPLESTDVPDPGAGSGSALTAPGPSLPSSDTLNKLQNNQIRQDVESLQQQLQEEDAETRRLTGEFLALLLRDPTIFAVNRSLEENGFHISDPGVSPITNVSGNFSFSYDRSGQPALVRGVVDDGTLLVLDETGGGGIPLPDPLIANETFRSYDRDLGQGAFSRNASRVHVEPGLVTVNLTYRDATGRTIHLDAAIANGTVSGIERETLTESFPFLGALLGVLLVGLLFGGVIFLGRHIRTARPPVVPEPLPEEPRPGYPVVAEAMLREAEAMAAAGHSSDAYARAGQALRFFVSHSRSDGRELTNEETVALPGHDSGNGKIGMILDRCSRVVFAKGEPDPEEFKKILADIRVLLVSGPDEDATRQKPAQSPEQ